jgi:uncharacterized protein
MPTYREAVCDFIRSNAVPPDKYSHQARLYRVATRLADDTPYDDEVLFAAAWLHDLGVFIGHRPDDPAQLATWDHLGYAMRKAPEILAHCGFPPNKIDAVVEAIRTHMPSGIPTTWEATLLRDADILEQLGAVGILRTVSKVGRDTRFILFADALKVLQRNLDELPAQLRLESTRREAQARIAVLREFLDAAQIETGKIPW